MTGRLPPPWGLMIDRDRPLTFRFEGRRIDGFAGDTIGSALAGAGVRLWSRSFKYHRPRGPVSMDGHEAGTLVQLPGEPNVAAELMPAADGLVVTAQNCSGGVDRDRGALIERFGRFLPVGFYYKAFFRPRGAWAWWEPWIRRAAGLGRVDPDHRADPWAKRHLFADVAVIGGGPAGLNAALAAAGAGASVLLVERGPRLGGALLHTGRADEAAALAAAVAAEPRIAVLTGATCTGWFADHLLPVLHGRTMVKARVRATVVATGVIEQPAVFRGNDLPGVMTASAVRRLMHLWAVRPGRRAVVLAANGEGVDVALDLAAAGIEVAAVVDLRPQAPRAGALAAAGIRVVPAHAVVEAVPRRDGRGLGAAVLAPIDAAGAAGAPDERIDCDLLCMAVGYAPAAALLCHAGARIGYDDRLAMFTVEAVPPGLFAAGGVANVFGPAAVVEHGRRAGAAAARHAAGAPPGEWPAPPPDPGGLGINHPFPCFPHPKGGEFVDFDEDLQIRDILDAVAEGYDHIELVKRYTTAGMGPGQGRLSALAVARLVARATGSGVGATGTTTARPPAVPEPMAALAGRAFESTRRTPMHDRHVEAGAQMMVAGTWLRPAFYGPPGDRAAAVEAEALAVRRGAGLIDVSTLGGIEIRGPDAATFLERVYAGAFAGQKPGRLRYALACDETGAVVDDGVACRLAERHFYLTATTGAADAVHRQMLWWNAQWRLDVDIANVTAAWCGISLAGPLSRRVLAPVAGLDLAPDAFPYLAVREGMVAGIACRLLRVGFVGELGYEIHAPAGQGEALWDALLAAGAPHGVRPVGIEAQRLLRLEKGHVIVGQDTDGLTLPDEAGLGWAVARSKPFFVGGRAIAARAGRPSSRRLVGFTLADDAPAVEECHLVIRDGAIAGRVTSVARSPTLGRTIGLAYVPPDLAAPGGRFRIKGAGGRPAEATVAALPFYDPAGDRQAVP